jgi:two-component system, OmpR family, sensor histidine kinase VicK
MNYTRPQLAIVLDSIRNSFIDAKNRGVKLRYLTEITSENISYCKELLPIVNEIRHLDGIKGNFMISESEYLAPVILFEEGKVASQLIHSNQRVIVDQYRYMFDTLWNKAMSAQQRIKDIEEGFERPETRVLKNKEEIFEYMKSIAENANEQSTCCSIGGMQLVYNYFFNEYKKIVDRSSSRRKKESNGVRWITSIEKDSIDLAKIFLDSGMQVRHVKNLTHADFAVDNKNFNATIDKMEGGKLMDSLLISNEPAYISHYNSVFEELWKNGVDATERIRDIEAGVNLADIEVIPNSARAQERYLDVVRSAEEEILWIFPTINAFIRQDKIGAIPLAKEKNIKIKILVPFHESIEDKIRKLKEEQNNNNSTDNSGKKDVRYIEQMSETKSTILVVDRKVSLVMELKDDTKSTFYEAIGLSTYSNSKAGVLSYVAIFENLWRQAELYQQVKTSNKQLEVNDKMQKEFINIAAHELRNPIQPIIGLSEVLRSRTKDTDQYEFLDAIIRSAKRLQQLTENILNVAQIENHSLKLNKERFNLTVLITNIIKDYKNQLEEDKGKGKGYVKLLYKNRHGKGYDDNEDLIFVDADAGSIAQVISNLLNNAIKFTKVEAKDKTITIIVDNKDDKAVVVSVEDTGSGIDSEIFPKLFSKFVTNSDAGTGLGLFISKNIVEAHGGKMWAENNSDNKDVKGEGATFRFSLPISKENSSIIRNNSEVNKLVAKQ